MSCHEPAAGQVAVATRRATVALVAAPNVGKSTLFNAATGARQHVVNAPGTTVELATGVWRAADDAPPAPATVMLDSDKARQLLGWRERKGLDEGIPEAVAWHKAARRGADMAAIAAAMLDAYLAD